MTRSSAGVKARCRNPVTSTPSASELLLPAFASRSRPGASPSRPASLARFSSRCCSREMTSPNTVLSCQSAKPRSS
jgi:hypothetical protein